MQTITTIGLDIAKSVFQVHGVDAEGNVLLRRQLRGGHYGQRSGVPHSKAEHMAAPTNTALVKKSLPTWSRPHMAQSGHLASASLRPRTPECDRRSCPLQIDVPKLQPPVSSLLPTARHHEPRFRSAAESPVNRQSLDQVPREPCFWRLRHRLRRW
jgi:hypothetical protein